MIIFDHVSKVYPNGTVGLDDVDLTIQDGEFVAIIGPESFYITAKLIFGNP